MSWGIWARMAYRYDIDQQPKKITGRSDRNNRINKYPYAKVPIRPRLKVTCIHVLVSGQ